MPSEINIILTDFNLTTRATRAGLQMNVTNSGYSKGKSITCYMLKFSYVVKIDQDQCSADFKLARKTARPGLWNKVANHGYSKGFEKQISTLGFQKLPYMH